MKIRTRLAIRFTLIVASLLVIFACSIYFLSNSRREKQFRKRLEEKSLNLCRLITEVNEVNIDLLKIIDKTTVYLPNESITIYDQQNKQVFNTRDSLVHMDNSFLERVRAEKELHYQQNGNEVLAFNYGPMLHNYVVIASAFDEDGLERLHTLELNLYVGLFICVIVTMVAGWIFAGQALDPISGVIDQVEKITASNLNLRVNAGNGTDEIAQLAVTFNRMLTRIQQAFDLQKSFVSNSSHELRTPLTAITGQLEVALMKKRNVEEYEAVIKSVLEDIKSVNNLTNGLLELSQAGMDVSRLKMKDVRIDELLWLIRNELLRRHPDYDIQIEIQYPDDEEKLIRHGSEHLLRSAFINLMDNACKFSPDKKMQVLFNSENGQMVITFSDKGVGISEDDLKKLGQPFFRGSNAKAFPGHGLGLSLVSKIISLHGGQMNIDSRVNAYTRVTVTFAHK